MAAQDDAASKHNAFTRKRPNVLITGTPGTGKSTLSEQLKVRRSWQCQFCRQDDELVQENIGFKLVNVGQLVRSLKRDPYWVTNIYYAADSRWWIPWWA